MLGRVLGEALVEQEGPDLFDLEERIRTLAIRRRRGPRAPRPPPSFAPCSRPSRAPGSSRSSARSLSTSGS
jgi:hypothetical protein